MQEISSVHTVNTFYVLRLEKLSSDCSAAPLSGESVARVDKTCQKLVCTSVTSVSEGFSPQPSLVSNVFFKAKLSNSVFSLG